MKLFATRAAVPGIFLAFAACGWAQAKLPKVVFALTQAEVNVKEEAELRQLRTSNYAKFEKVVKSKKWVFVELNPRLHLIYNPKIVLADEVENYKKIADAISSDGYSSFGDVPPNVQEGVLDMLAGERDNESGIAEPKKDHPLWFDGEQSVTFVKDGKQVELECGYGGLLKQVDKLKAKVSYGAPASDSVLRSWSSLPSITEANIPRGMAIDTESQSPDGYVAVVELVTKYINEQLQKNGQALKDASNELAMKLLGGKDLVTLMMGNQFSDFPKDYQDDIRRQMADSFANFGFANAEEADSWLNSASIGGRSIRVMCMFATPAGHIVGFEPVPALRN